MLTKLHMCLHTLQSELEGMRMKDSKDVSSYITHVYIIANQLKFNGETLMDARVVDKILRSLNDDFENVVLAIEESRNLEEMIVNDLEGSLEYMNNGRRKKKQEVLDEA